MAFDSQVAMIVACCSLVACGPKVDLAGEANEPGGSRRILPKGRGEVRGDWLIGVMCPRAVGGEGTDSERMGAIVEPIAFRSVTWRNEAEALSETVERNAISPFTVFGFDGAVAGRFSSLGVAELPGKLAVASGSYNGGSVCTPNGGSPSAGKPQPENPACVAALRGCGLAIASASSRQAPAPLSGTACISSGMLLLDVAGGKQPRAYALAELLDGVRAPNETWRATSAAASACATSFTILGNRTDATSDGVAVDVLGVIDLDGDSRQEVVLALSYPTSKSIAIYGARSSSTDLELLVETKISILP